MKLCKEMIEAMGGADSGLYVRFRMLACEAYNILRKNADLILSLLHLMAGASIEAVRANPENAMLKLQARAAPRRGAGRRCRLCRGRAVGVGDARGQPRPEAGAGSPTLRWLPWTRAHPLFWETCLVRTPTVRHHRTPPTTCPAPTCLSQEKLRLDFDDGQAVEWMQQLINESATAMMPQIMETTHRWAQYWR
jgi:hypothetical protein